LKAGHPLEHAVDTRAFLAPAIANVFEELGISAALREGGPWRTSSGGWRAIHVHEPSLASFEIEHGVEGARAKYDLVCMNRAHRSKRLVRGEHAGVRDLFVPVIVGGRSVAVLASGSFSTTRPTSADVLTRWHWLTRRRGHPSDPEFAHYLSVTLSTLVLEGRHTRDFEKMLLCFVKLLSGGRGARETLAEADALRASLQATRSAEKAWDAARSMVDDRTQRAWSSSDRIMWLRQLGLSGAPDHALVGLIASARPTEVDAVDDRLRRDSFQRACVELAREQGELVAGRVGDYGVSFLAAANPSGRHRDRRLLHAAERATRMARSYGFRFHAGLSTLPRSALLAEQYQVALQAAELALSGGTAVVRTPPRSAEQSFPLYHLRKELGRLAQERPEELPARFDRYLEAVAVHSGYRLDAARAHLEAGIEHIASELLAARAWDQKTSRDAASELTRSSHGARTVAELFAVYRRAVSNMTEAARHPTPAHHDRSLQRALLHIQRNFTQTIRRATLAKLAGFAPNYFSDLFKRREGVSFESYLRKLRLDRAKQLLASTDLDLQRVAELSGMGTRFHLSRIFQRTFGMTPMAWRREASVQSVSRKRSIGHRSTASRRVR
jgi:AraC-like DNA-binding protein